MWPSGVENSSTLLSCDGTGDLLKWDLSKLKETTTGLRVGDDKVEAACEKVWSPHDKLMFGMASGPEGSVYSVGLDRHISCFNYKTNRPCFILPCFANTVIAMAASNLDPSTIAIGCGDSCVRVWKTQSKTNDGVDMEAIHCKTKGKVGKTGEKRFVFVIFIGLLINLDHRCRLAPNSGQPAGRGHR